MARLGGEAAKSSQLSLAIGFSTPLPASRTHCFLASPQTILQRKERCGKCRDARVIRVWPAHIARIERERNVHSYRPLQRTPTPSTPTGRISICWLQLYLSNTNRRLQRSALQILSSFASPDSTFHADGRATLAFRSWAMGRRRMGCSTEGRISRGGHRGGTMGMALARRERNYCGAALEWAGQ